MPLRIYYKIVWFVSFAICDLPKQESHIHLPVFSPHPDIRERSHNYPSKLEQRDRKTYNGYNNNQFAEPNYAKIIIGPGGNIAQQYDSNVPRNLNNPMNSRDAFVPPNYAKPLPALTQYGSMPQTIIIYVRPAPTGNEIALPQQPVGPANHERSLTNDGFLKNTRHQKVSYNKPFAHERQNQPQQHKMYNNNMQHNSHESIINRHHNSQTNNANFLSSNPKRSLGNDIKPNLQDRHRMFQSSNPVGPKSQHLERIPNNQHRSFIESPQYTNHRKTDLALYDEIVPRQHQHNNYGNVYRTQTNPKENYGKSDLEANWREKSSQQYNILNNPKLPRSYPKNDYAYYRPSEVNDMTLQQNNLNYNNRPAMVISDIKSQQDLNKAVNPNIPLYLQSNIISEPIQNYNNLFNASVTPKTQQMNNIVEYNQDNIKNITAQLLNLNLTLSDLKMTIAKPSLTVNERVIAPSNKNITINSNNAMLNLQSNNDITKIVDDVKSNTPKRQVLLTSNVKMTQINRGQTMDSKNDKPIYDNPSDLSPDEKTASQTNRNFYNKKQQNVFKKIQESQFMKQEPDYPKIKIAPQTSYDDMTIPKRLKYFKAVKDYPRLRYYNKTESDYYRNQPIRLYPRLIGTMSPINNPADLFKLNDKYNIIVNNTKLDVEKQTLKPQPKLTFQQNWKAPAEYNNIILQPNTQASINSYTPVSTTLIPPMYNTNISLDNANLVQENLLNYQGYQANQYLPPTDQNNLNTQYQNFKEMSIDSKINLPNAQEYNNISLYKSIEMPPSNSYKDRNQYGSNIHAKREYSTPLNKPFHPDTYWNLNESSSYNHFPHQEWSGNRANPPSFPFNDSMPKEMEWPPSQNISSMYTFMSTAVPNSADWYQEKQAERDRAFFKKKMWYMINKYGDMTQDPKRRVDSWCEQCNLNKPVAWCGCSRSCGDSLKGWEFEDFRRLFTRQRSIAAMYRCRWRKFIHDNIWYLRESFLNLFGVVRWYTTKKPKTILGTGWQGWKPMFGGKAPTDAFQAGVRSERIIYVVRAKPKNRDALIPGMLLDLQTCARINNNGPEECIYTYQVLVGTSYTWLYVPKAHQYAYRYHPNRVSGGKSYSQEIFICRVNTKQGHLISFMIPERGCFISDYYKKEFGGYNIQKYDFELLID